MLLRGQAFRSDADDFARGLIRHNVDSCDPAFTGRQLAATHSLISKVVEPLEHRNNTVQLFVHESSHTRCEHLMDLLLKALRTSRHRTDRPRAIVASLFRRRWTQSAAFHEATQFFCTHIAGRNASAYALVLIARHDLLWRLPIDGWSPPARFETLNVISRCELATSPQVCVNDWAFMMPGRQFGSFNAAMHRCPMSWRQSWSLHHCASALQNASEVAFLSDWRPRTGVREGGCPVANPIASVNWTLQRAP